jgi:hypothetical protein
MQNVKEQGRKRIFHHKPWSNISDYSSSDALERDRYAVHAIPTVETNG